MVAQHRATFLAPGGFADALADEISPDLVRLPPQGLTTRAAWYEDVDRLVAVVGEHEGRSSDLVLAHGLLTAGDRRLELVLPDAWSTATRHRVPWLTADVCVHVHQGPGTVSTPAAWSKEETRQRAGDPETTPALHLGQHGTSWLGPLLDYASRHQRLSAAHTRDTRSWSCDGQRVLTIQGRSAFVVKAGIDAKADPAHVVTVEGPLTTTQLDLLVAQVEQGVTQARAKAHGTFGEHDLQVRLRSDPRLLGLEHPILREVPAWRPTGGGKELGRGYVDLVGLDPVGDVTIVETKLGGDDMLVLQGLDYWIWATRPANREWLVRRLHADPRRAEVKLLFAVEGKGTSPGALNKYAAVHYDLLDPEIPKSFLGLRSSSSSA